MKTNILFIALLAFLTGKVPAQQIIYVLEGAIHFEKTINQYAIYKKQIASNAESSAFSLEAFKQSYPQFHTATSTLTFSGKRALYQPDRQEEKKHIASFMIGQPNIVYTDFEVNKRVVQKSIGGETLLVSDSLQRITWKITNETREIAGFKCRRANGIVLDSVYVVAFYTVDIPISGGPESFSGLPGMILGVALPYEHVTWFATSVRKQAVKSDGSPVKAKGKPVEGRDLDNVLTTVFGIKDNQEKKALLF